MELSEKGAKLIYQFCYLIDDKNIEQHWRELNDRARFFDCYDALIQQSKPEGEVPEMKDEEIEQLLEIEFHNTYSGHVEEYRDVAKATRAKIKQWLEGK